MNRGMYIGNAAGLGTYRLQEGNVTISNILKGGMHLTPPHTTYSVALYGGLSAKSLGVRKPLF